VRQARGPTRSRSAAHRRGGPSAMLPW
jgi:hypothetical protein